MTKRKKKPKWKLDPREVGGYGTGGGRGKPQGGKWAKRPRADRGTSWWEMELVHMPTGVKVSGNIPERAYSKREMRDLHEKLYAKLFAILEKKVAAKLRIPGQQRDEPTE